MHTNNKFTVLFNSNDTEQQWVIRALDLLRVDYCLDSSTTLTPLIAVVGQAYSYPKSLFADQRPTAVICFSDKPDFTVAGVTFVSWPGSSEKLAMQLDHWVKSVYIQRDGADLPVEITMIGHSPRFQQFVAVIRQVSRYDAPVLLKGETGTGKEIAARAVHYLGARRDKPFIPINCGAYNDDMFASDLFGYEKGAFTDAKQTKPGLVEQARGGTLFLDEIDSLSLKSQVALLRFIQDQEYRPMGGLVNKKANVRLIAASNQNLGQLVKQRLLREDLYYRLDILGIDIPPLRERKEDIEQLCEHFLDQFSRHYQQPIKTLHSDTLAWVGEYRWPGNIRELENYLHKLYILSTDDEICVPQVKGLPGEVSFEQLLQQQSGVLGSFQEEKSRVVSQFEKKYLIKLLKACRGNMSQAARWAGKERRSFGRLIKKHGIQRDLYMHDKSTGEVM